MEWSQMFEILETVEFVIYEGVELVWNAGIEN
jgi:hypothetical protein